MMPPAVKVSVEKPDFSPWTLPVASTLAMSGLMLLKPTAKSSREVPALSMTTTRRRTEAPRLTFTSSVATFDAASRSVMLATVSVLPGKKRRASPAAKPYGNWLPSSPANGTSMSDPSD